MLAVLQHNPQDSDALRCKLCILLWTSKFEEALQLLKKSQLHEEQTAFEKVLVEHLACRLLLLLLLPQHSLQGFFIFAGLCSLSTEPL